MSALHLEHYAARCPRGAQEICHRAVHLGDKTLTSSHKAFDHAIILGANDGCHPRRNKLNSRIARDLSHACHGVLGFHKWMIEMSSTGDNETSPIRGKVFLRGRAWCEDSVR
eukprot:4140541-Amphidinium_carterae.1